MNLLERDEFAGLSVAPFEDLFRTASGFYNLETRAWWLSLCSTYSGVCSLSKLLQLLERREMAFAVHSWCF